MIIKTTICPTSYPHTILLVSYSQSSFCNLLSQHYIISHVPPHFHTASVIHVHTFTTNTCNHFFSDNSAHPKSQCCSKYNWYTHTIHNQANHHPDVLHHTLPQSTDAQRLQKALQQGTKIFSWQLFSHACAIHFAYLLRPNMPPCRIHISIWSACMPQMHTCSFQWWHNACHPKTPASLMMHKKHQTNPATTSKVPKHPWQQLHWNTITTIFLHLS